MPVSRASSAWPTQPIKPNADGMGSMTLQGMSLEQLADRRKMLASFDNLRRDLDATGGLLGADESTKQALEHPDVEPAGRRPRPGARADPGARRRMAGAIRSRPVTATPAR